MNKWIHDAFTLAHAAVLGEYDVPPTAVVLAEGNTVQLVLGGLKEDHTDSDGWQDALRAVREELDGSAVMLFFSAWTRIQRDDKEQSLDTLIVQVGTPDSVYFRAYEQVRDHDSRVITSLRELESLREVNDPDADAPMAPFLGNMFEPTTRSFRESESYLDLIDTVTEKLNEKAQWEQNGRGAYLH